MPGPAGWQRARFAFILEGHVQALRVPALDAPDAWPLWQHTCFEVFVSTPGKEHYREFSFSPAGLWAASAFRRYCEIDSSLTAKLAASAPPVLETEQSDAALRLMVRLPLALLPSGLGLRVGLAAVIKCGDGANTGRRAIIRWPNAPISTTRAAGYFA